MRYFFVNITADADGAEFERMREGEIGIGHESEIIIMLARKPIIASRDDVFGLLQQYWGPDGPVALSNRPLASDEAANYYDDFDHAHGLEWRDIAGASIETLIATTWLDQNERSLYLANLILDGSITGATEDERDLAVSWQAYAQELGPQPARGLREEPFRAEQRAYYAELVAALDALGEDKNVRDTFSRLDEQRVLADGTVMVVERVYSDGGHYLGWFCVSRYEPELVGRDDGLLDRLHI